MRRTNLLKIPVKKILKAAAIALPFLLILSSMLYVPMKNIAAFLPRYGRVVDANTGEGLAHVPVIAFATIATQSGWGSMGTRTLYRTITYTGADGYYSVTSHWGSIPLFPTFPGDFSEIRWAITALKLGYAVQGDEAEWELPSGGQYHSPSPYKKPDYRYGFWGLYIEPIRMEKVDLSLYQAAHYYWDIISATHTYNRIAKQTEEEKALRRPFYDYFMPKVCALDPDTRLNWSAGDFVDEPRKYDYLMIDIGTEVEKKSPGQGKDVGWIAVYQCKVLKMAEDPR